MQVGCNGSPTPPLYLLDYQAAVRPALDVIFPLVSLSYLFLASFGYFLAFFFGAHFALQTYSVSALLVFLCCCCFFSGCNLVNFPNTNITFYVSHPQTQILGWISSLLVNCSFVVFSYVVHALLMVSLLELTHHILYFHFYCADKQQQKISIKMLRQGNKT